MCWVGIKFTYAFEGLWLTTGGVLSGGLSSDIRLTHCPAGARGVGRSALKVDVDSSFLFNLSRRQRRIKYRPKLLSRGTANRQKNLRRLGTVDGTNISLCLSVSDWSLAPRIAVHPDGYTAAVMSTEEEKEQKISTIDRKIVLI